jgi:hypothetical protein
MSFDWLEPKRVARTGDPFREQYVRAITQRARLFFNLGYPEGQATDRIQAALRWEFDADIASTPVPPFYAQVPELVASEYKRARGSRG